MRIFSVFLILAVALYGCAGNQAAKDDKLLKQYISEHHLNAVAEPNGLYYVETVTGTGGSPGDSSTIKVIYTGYFTNGVIFDQSYNLPVQFQLYNNIKGWQEGIPLMKKGGSAKLLIPSALAYGSAGIVTSGVSIPPNSVLIFDIQLVDYQ